MYTKRNTITLTILLLTVLSIGITWWTRENAILKRVRLRNEKISKQFHGSNVVARTLQSVETKYISLKENWDQAPKKVIAVEEPAFTVSYINWIVQENNLDIDFDFTLDDIIVQDEISYFTFTMDGEVTYHDLYQFISHLTNNPILYQIEYLALVQKHEDSDRQNFKLRVRGFFMAKKFEMINQVNFADMKSIDSHSRYFDIFKSIISRPPKSNPSVVSAILKSEPVVKKEIKSFLDIESSKLLGLANGNVYILTGNSKMVALSVRDRVDYGELVEIDKQKSEAIFILNKDGEVRRIVLGLGYKR